MGVLGAKGSWPHPNPITFGLASYTPRRRPGNPLCQVRAIATTAPKKKRLAQQSLALPLACSRRVPGMAMAMASRVALAALLLILTDAQTTASHRHFHVSDPQTHAIHSTLPES